jgi:hypothetical protein
MPPASAMGACVAPNIRTSSAGSSSNGMNPPGFLRRYTKQIALASASVRVAYMALVDNDIDTAHSDLWEAACQFQRESFGFHWRNARL